MPGSEGEFGVLREHSPLVATLSIGVVRIKDGGNVEQVAVRGGFVQVRENRIALLADEAIKASEVDRLGLEKESVEVEAKLLDAAVGVDERTKLYGVRDWIRAKQLL